MREYLVGTALIWVLALALWCKLVDPFASGHDKTLAIPSAHADQIIAECRQHVKNLYAMSDKLLKAGGQEVPVALRKYIEDCLASDSRTLEQLRTTPLIRLFQVG